jgi:hypothetical protein
MGPILHAYRAAALADRPERMQATNRLGIGQFDACYIVMPQITNGRRVRRIRRQRKAGASMIAVDLRIPTDGREYATAATVEVRDGHAEFRGRRELFDTNLATFDAGAGERVRFDTDPERWARNLATVYRTGQLVPVITADTNPNPPRRRSGRPDITIPKR